MKYFIFLLVGLILLSGCTQNKEQNENGAEQVKEPQNKNTGSGMAFTVETPQNKREGDTVWIYIGQTPYKMEKVTDYLFSVHLSESQLFKDTEVKEGEKIRYRYSRNGYDFHTAEYLEPTSEEPDRDTNNYFWTKQGRETEYTPGKIQEDKIQRWRWFPESGLPIKTASLEPEGNFLQRINGLEFRSGQTIEDLYVLAFHDFFDSTAQHLKDQEYRWVELDPPWQWVEENGLPKAVNDIKNNPSLLQEIDRIRTIF